MKQVPENIPYSSKFSIPIRFVNKSIKTKKTKNKTIKKTKGKKPKRGGGRSSHYSTLKKY